MNYPFQSYLILEIYALINFVIMFFVFFFLKKKELTMVQKGIIYTIFSVLTTIIHYIPVFIELFKGTPIPFNELSDIYYLPVWPCNMMMWAYMLFIPFVFKKNKVSDLLAPFLFVFGSICGFFGLVLNFNFLDNPVWENIVGIKSIVSHVTLIYSAISLMVFGYVDFRTIRSLLSSLIGLEFFLICHLLCIGVLTLQGKDLSNFDPLFFHGFSENARWLNIFLLVPLGFFALMIATTIYESKRLPLEERWYYKFKKLFSKKEKIDDRNS